MNIADLRDMYLGAQAEVTQMIAEAEREWTEPDDRLKIAAMAEMMDRENPEAWRYVPPEIEGRVMEVLNGR